MENVKNIKDVNRESMSKLLRSVVFGDIFFMSLRVQAPFFSMLTYATFALTLTLFFSPIVLIIGTLVVIINGTDIYYLLKKAMRKGDTLIMHISHHRKGFWFYFSSS